TYLKADTTTSDVIRLCEEAIHYGFASVCIPPFFVQNAVQFLKSKGSKIPVATVVGFPMGYATTASKIEEIKRAIDDGAHEIDAVINVSAIKSQNWTYVRNDMYSMTTAVGLKGKKIKIIIETSLLELGEIDQLCELALEIKPHFLKTSTGFNGTGATLGKVRRMKARVGDHIAIKASGGIRTFAKAKSFVDAGVSRIGASAGIQIVEESRK
ncbi:MAG: deoxyribose-phosphate aldolase, partial [Bacteroidota bacterium]